MPKKHGIQVCILLHLQSNQWRTTFITQVVSLNRCDLFFVILVRHTSLVIEKENFNFVAQDILERT